MIDGSEKRKRQLAFELQNSHVFEKRSKDCHAYATLARFFPPNKTKAKKPLALNQKRGDPMDIQFFFHFSNMDLWRLLLPLVNRLIG